METNSYQLKGLEEIHFTPTQRDIMDLLSDGRPHSRREVHACLPDDLGALSNINWHIMSVRNKIREPGYIITIKFTDRRLNYVLSRSLNRSQT